MRLRLPQPPEWQMPDAGPEARAGAGPEPARPDARSTWPFGGRDALSRLEDGLERPIVALQSDRLRGGERRAEALQVA